MRRSGDLVLGLAIGAGLMYLLDPDRGTRRRALLRDQLVHAGHQMEGIGDAAAERAADLRNRARGTLHEARARFSDEEVSDPVLEARVRSELGHSVSAPGTVHVRAENGRIFLSGDVPRTEEAQLLAAVKSVRGVQSIENQIETRHEAGNVPRQQGTSA